MINETRSNFTFSLPFLVKDFKWNSASTHNKSAIQKGKLGWGKTGLEVKKSRPYKIKIYGYSLMVRFQIY